MRDLNIYKYSRLPRHFSPVPVYVKASTRAFATCLVNIYFMKRGWMVWFGTVTDVPTHPRTQGMNRRVGECEFFLTRCGLSHFAPHL